MALAKEKRRAEIVRYIEGKKSATGAELSEIFHVTEETIRKDLQELSQRGALIRTFGGATIREYGAERPLNQRTIQNYAQKQKIASCGIPLITPGSLIMLDAGSTISAMAKLIPQDLSIVGVTNSLENTNILSQNPGVSVYCTGGRLHQKSLSFQGSLAEHSISSYNAEKAFISCSAVDLHLGVMDSNEEEARVKQQMIHMAREVYLLADSSKIGGLAHITTCAIQEITALITDSGISDENRARFEEAGIRVIAAE